MNKNINMYTIEATQGTIKELIKNFINGSQIVFVINPENKLLGAVTEGGHKAFF